MFDLAAPARSSRSSNPAAPDAAAAAHQLSLFPGLMAAAQQEAGTRDVQQQDGASQDQQQQRTAELLPCANVCSPKAWEVRCRNITGSPRVPNSQPQQ